jgi:hypothetical protein
MHKSATKCNEIIGKWCKNKHGASKIIDTLETYHFVHRSGAAPTGCPRPTNHPLPSPLPWAKLWCHQQQRGISKARRFQILRSTTDVSAGGVRICCSRHAQEGPRIVEGIGCSLLRGTVDLFYNGRADVRTKYGGRRRARCRKLPIAHHSSEAHTILGQKGCITTSAGQRRPPGQTAVTALGVQPPLSHLRSPPKASETNRLRCRRPQSPTATAAPGIQPPPPARGQTSAAALGSPSTWSGLTGRTEAKDWHNDLLKKVHIENLMEDERARIMEKEEE